MLCLCLHYSAAQVPLLWCLRTHRERSVSSDTFYTRTSPYSSVVPLLATSSTCATGERQETINRHGVRYTRRTNHIPILALLNIRPRSKGLSAHEISAVFSAHSFILQRKMLDPAWDYCSPFIESAWIKLGRPSSLRPITDNLESWHRLLRMDHHDSCRRLRLALAEEKRPPRSLHFAFDAMRACHEADNKGNSQPGRCQGAASLIQSDACQKEADHVRKMSRKNTCGAAGRENDSRSECPSLRRKRGASASTC